MGRLVLVRHGQASFLDDDYDRLSQSGETQSLALGSFWARHGTRFDEVFSGPLNRQIRTAELVASTYGETRPPLPQYQRIPELEEYDSRAIMAELPALVAEKNPAIHKLMEDYERSKGSAQEPRAFQKLFEIVMQEWISGGLAHPGVEPWKDFTERVRRALARLTEGEARGRRIAVFTSGGPISAAMQAALGVSDLTTLELNWQIRNCSLTEFLFSSGRFTLDSFNTLPHLPDPSMWTYR
jgi:broad specificity phosphatase PhoE